MFYVVEASLKITPTSEILFNQDIELSKAIENSIIDAGHDFITYEPLNPESSKRKNGVPVGLKNIGNTCYFNSLVQFYFMIPKLALEIITYSCHHSHKTQEPPQDEGKKLEFFRKKACITLVENLQMLFSSMICSIRKYIDPSKVLHALVDDFGNQILVGDQKDVGEFHMILVACIEEGLKAKFQLEENAQEEEEKLKIEERKKEPEGGSPSVRRKESINYTGHRLSENRLIFELFYAKQIEYLKIPSNDNQVLRNEVVFGQIMLDVSEKDLYSAWDASYHCIIEDYLINNTHAAAIQEIWPQKFPGVLLFQIQRVKYDISSNMTIKINTPFTFPEEVYTDRFLLENKEECSKIREEMLELKRKARILERNVEMFTNYENSGISLENILENVQLFLHMQRKPQQMEDGSTTTPENSLYESPDIKKTTKVLRSYKHEAKRCLETMQFEIKTIYNQIEQLYAKAHLQKNRYKLHSLLIHDGYAGSGHYYAFVHDIEDDK